jgi:hypothetical protein
MQNDSQMQTSLLLVFLRVETHGTDQGITFSPFVTRLKKQAGMGIEKHLPAIVWVIGEAAKSQNRPPVT